MNQLIIIGASGHGKVTADIAIKMNQWQSIAFLDDDETITQSMGLEVIGKTADAFSYKNRADFFVAIGNNVIRERVQEFLLTNGIQLTKLIHPTAVIGTDVEIGFGTAVMAGAVINSSTRIGKGCIINTGASIDHDNLIGDYVHISPGVITAGGVTVGRGTWVGIGSVISNNVAICGRSIIGAGGLVLRTISESGTYVGSPVRRIDQQET